jgi:hypothetical protein
MSEPNPNAFIGKTEAPKDADVAGALGTTKVLWDELTSGMAAQCGVTIQEWNSYSVKAGWALRLKKGKRTILWMSPCAGYFQVTYILGGKAMKAVRDSGPSARLLRIIDQAVKYPEGWGIRLPIKGAKDLPVIYQLAAFKLAN